ncbi:hypothetical protein SCUP515_06594 [Seiridium cupressi]
MATSLHLRVSAFMATLILLFCLSSDEHFPSWLALVFPLAACATFGAIPGLSLCFVCAATTLVVSSDSLPFIVCLLGRVAWHVFWLVATALSFAALGWFSVWVHISTAADDEDEPPRWFVLGKDITKAIWVTGCGVLCLPVLCVLLVPTLITWLYDYIAGLWPQRPSPRRIHHIRHREHPVRPSLPPATMEAPVQRSWQEKRRIQRPLAPLRRLTAQPRPRFGLAFPSLSSVENLPCFPRPCFPLPSMVPPPSVVPLPSTLPPPTVMMSDEMDWQFDPPAIEEPIVEKPVVVEEPMVIKELIKEPMAIEEPMEIEEPMAIEEPAALESTPIPSTVAPSLPSFGSTPFCPPTLDPSHPADWSSPLSGLAEELEAELMRDSDEAFTANVPTSTFDFQVPFGTPTAPSGFTSGNELVLQEHFLQDSTGEDETKLEKKDELMEDSEETRMKTAFNGTFDDNLGSDINFNFDENFDFNNARLDFTLPASATAPHTGSASVDQVPGPAHMDATENLYPTNTPAFSFDFNPPSGAPIAPTAFAFGPQVGAQNMGSANTAEEEGAEEPEEEVDEKELERLRQEARDRFYDAPCDLSDELPDSEDEKQTLDDVVIPYKSIPRHLLATPTPAPKVQSKCQARY